MQSVNVEILAILHSLLLHAYDHAHDDTTCQALRIYRRNRRFSLLQTHEQIGDIFHRK